MYSKEAIDKVLNDEGLRSDRVLVLYLPECHESLAGIIAGRLRETFGKPAFVLTKTDDGIKGSGRSVDAYDMHAEMTRCSDLFIKFGGHKAAAGLSMDEDKISELRKRLNDNCTLTEDEMAEKLTADIALPLSYATYELAEELEKLEPYGIGNPHPLFAQKDLQISDIRVFGKNRNVVKMKLSEAVPGSQKVDAICFGDGDAIEAELVKKDRISVMYELGINEYNGRSNVQLTIKDWK
jgi:single-stranded-DNA-specific exonuclease